MSTDYNGAVVVTACDTFPVGQVNIEDPDRVDLNDGRRWWHSRAYTVVTDWSEEDAIPAVEGIVGVETQWAVSEPDRDPTCDPLVVFTRSSQKAHAIAATFDGRVWTSHVLTVIDGWKEWGK